MAFSKVIEIEGVKHNFDKQKRDGGTYNCSTFSYRDEKGELRETATATAFLEKNVGLKSQIQALEIGQKYVLTSEKNDAGFWNVTSIVPDDGTVSVTQKTPPTNKSTYSKGKGTYVDNSLGMQVGNALNNAAALVAAGHGKDLKTTAEMVLRLGEELKVRLAAGEFAAKKAETTQLRPVAQTKVQETIVDEEIPFGD